MTNNPIFSLEEKVFFKKSAVLLTLTAAIGLLCSIYCNIVSKKVILYAYIVLCVIHVFLWAMKRVHSLTRRRDKVSRLSVILDLCAWLIIIGFWITLFYMFGAGLVWLVTNAIT